MKKQNGSVALILVGILGALMVCFVAVLGLSYVSAYNQGNDFETQLNAILSNNENIYAQGTQKVLEVAQVPAMYTDDLKSLIKQDIEGRYGKGGSKATFQFLKEHEIKLEPAMYTKIQQMVEAFRNEFQANQTRMVDVTRAYSKALGSFWGGMWLRIAGYPKVDLAKFKPISTDAARKVFESGKETAPLKLR